MRGLAHTKALVANWMDVQTPRAAPLCEALRHIIHAEAPELVEIVRWGQLVFMLDHRQPVLSIATHKTHASLQVFNAQDLGPLADVLDGSGKGPRVLKCRYGVALDVTLVTELVHEGVRVARLHPPPPRTDS